MIGVIKNNFNPKSFAVGLGIVTIIYVLLFAYVALNSAKTLSKLELKLASHSEIIKRDSIPLVDLPNDFASDPLNATPPVDGNALIAAPVNGLYETSTFGVLPKIAESGATPFNVYKKPFPLPGKPMIAVAVMDYGLSLIHI